MTDEETQFEENLEFLLKLDDTSFKKFMDQRLIDMLHVEPRTINVFIRLITLEVPFATRTLLQVLDHTEELFNLESYLLKSKFKKFSDSLKLEMHSIKVTLDFKAEIENYSDFKPEFKVLLERKYKNGMRLDLKDLYFIIDTNANIKLMEDDLNQIESLFIQAIELNSILSHFGKLYLLCLLMQRDHEELLGLLLDGPIDEPFVNPLADFEPEKLWIIKNGPFVDHQQLQVVLSSEPVEKKESVLSERRNVFDGDEFDVFAHGKVAVERVDPQKEVLIRQEQKFKTLALLEDDEYDDSYDDVLNAEEEDQKPNPIERFLVELYTTNPSIFHKSTRKSAERVQALKKAGMSDEQFEGWYIMLNRNPHKDRVLEKYEWRGNRHVPEDEQELEDFVKAEKGEAEDRDETAESPGKKEVSGKKASPNANTRGRGRGRGRGRWHRPQ